MTNEERWELYRCVTAMLSRSPTGAEWTRFVETWHWLEVGNGKPPPTPEAWGQWLNYLKEKHPNE